MFVNSYVQNIFFQQHVFENFACRMNFKWIYLVYLLRMQQCTWVARITVLYDYNCMLFARFADLRFVNYTGLLEADLPLLPAEFEALVKKQCWEAHEVLRKRSVSATTCNVVLDDSVIDSSNHFDIFFKSMWCCILCIWILINNNSTWLLVCDNFYIFFFFSMEALNFNVICVCC